MRDEAYLSMALTRNQTVVMSLTVRIEYNRNLETTFCEVACEDGGNCLIEGFLGRGEK